MDKVIESLLILLGGGLFAFLLITSISSFSYEHSIENLGLQDTLAKYYVLKYYPKFENCSIIYSSIERDESGFKNLYGAKIYCNDLNKLGPRDGMKVVEESGIPTKELIFEDIKLKEIYKIWKEDLK